jgi:hypothetical protein
VLINPQYSGYLPVVDYHFYNIDGKSETLHFPSTDELGNFKGKLPVGTYRVIATNRFESESGFDAKNTVVFTGWESYDEFIVKAAPDAPDSRGFLSRAGVYMLSQPDSVYSIVISEAFVVTQNDTIRRVPAPELLTKRLNLEFTLEAGLEAGLASMTGVLSGIYPGVRLSTFEGVEINKSSDMAVDFETVPGERNRRRAKILYFGLLDPDDGRVYDNVLELTLKMNDGTIFDDVKVNISEALSEMLKRGGGTIPSQFSIPITVRKTSLGIVLVVAEVDEWLDIEGEWTGEVVL